MKEKFSYLPQNQRKKIMLICDDIRVHSGVATVARELVINTCHHFNWINLGGGINHPDKGKRFDLSTDTNTNAGIDDSSIFLYPVEGYGDPDLIRQLIEIEKPDAIMLITDPRYFEWLFAIENEIRKQIPIIYLNIWDDYPVNMYTSSFFVVRNANKLYSQYSASAYNFAQNTTTQSNCLTVSASLYPYQFDEIEINQNIKLGQYGPNKFKNVKINKATQNVEARLMPNETSVVNNLVTTDSNLLAVYISPFKVRDDDILNFLGEYDIMDLIGNPSNIFVDNYESLQTLRNNYNKYNLSEQVLYQEFMTLYKNYFDGSFFETVTQLLPARSKVIDGILIEPSLLERNKYQNRPIDSAIAYDLSSSVACSFVSSSESSSCSTLASKSSAIQFRAQDFAKSFSVVIISICLFNLK